MTKSASVKIYALLLGLTYVYSALGENLLPTLGLSTNADDVLSSEENTMGRFFKSTSQPMILTTTPPSMIMPTSTISTSITRASQSSSSSLPRVTSEDEKEASNQMDMSTSETLVKSENSKNTFSKDRTTTKSSIVSVAVDPNETKAQSTQGPSTSSSEILVTQEMVTQDSSSIGTIEVRSNSDSIESSIESIVTSSEDLFVSTTSLFEASTITKQPLDSTIGKVDIEATTASIADSDTLPKPESSSVNVPFLAPKVSSAAAASRPQSQPRVAPANIEALDKMIVGEPGMQIINKTNEKKTRQSNSNAQLPGVNDLLNGLLNVVGEGLTFATNFVKEENQRKKEAAASKLALEKEKELLLQSSISAVPALLPGRVNNRGPPRFTEIPFEAIPLEILNSQRPGQEPVQIPQRPFHTRIKITKTKLPPFASGIPLPEVLIPGFEMPTTPSTTTTATEGKLENEVMVQQQQPKRNATNENRVRFPLSSIPKTPPKLDLADLVKLQNEYNNAQNNGNDKVDLKLLQPSKTLDETTTIYATASNILPKWPPRRRPIPGKIEATRRPPLRPQPTNQIRTPPVRPQRPYPRPPPPSLRPPLSKPQNINVNPINEPEVLFSGQAFDLQPSRQPVPSRPEVFDLTVSVQQNFGGAKKPALMNQNDVIITKATAGGDQFVTIDGKKTYFDVGPTRMPNFAAPPPANPNNNQQPQRPQNDNANRYQPQEPVSQPIMNRPSYVDKLVPTRRPPAPPIRIDTCIVGDDTTCQIDKHEVCRTHLGVSSCDCKPGYGRSSHRKACKKTIRLMMSLQVDRIKQRQVRWGQSYTNPNSENYRTLEDEAIYAINTAMALTSLSNAYLSSDVNRFFNLNGKVTINATLLFLENSYTSSVVVKRDVQKKLLEVIQARNNNVGNGNLYVDSQLNPIPGVADVNECSEPELHDCDANFARCINRFGSFDCVCLPGYGDRFAEDPQKAGRYCESCSADYCYGRGTCLIQEGDQKTCECKGNYYGNQCEIDGEVVAVAVGASVAAVVIIILTLTCLCLWSRRWKREQRKAEIMRGFPPTYLNANPNPHMAATYMANLNKAAAYAAAVSANRHHSLMTPVYHQNQAMATSHEDLTAEGRMRVQQQQTKASAVDPYNQNIYAQLVPLGNGSQFQAQEFFQIPPPPNNPPPPIPASNEPLYAYPSSIYGTLPRGPPRPVQRPPLPFPEVENADEILEIDSTSAIKEKRRLERGLINYATFRQNVSAEAAAAALRRAEITAQFAKTWSPKDEVAKDNHDQDDEDETSSNSSSDEASEMTERVSSPSPSMMRRSRSNSPGKTVTFCEDSLTLDEEELSTVEENRSLNELDASPRRIIDLKPIAFAASNLIGSHLKLKRKAPSPPEATEVEVTQETPKNKTRHYAEIGFKNGVFTNPAQKKPQRSPSRRRKQETEEASLRRKPSVRSTRSSNYRIMDDEELDLTRSSFRSTRRHQFPDLIQHGISQQQYYNDANLRPPTRFSRY